ncbi:MAG: hypothetical protein CBR30_04410 [Dictyoglomus sp. NZ13-RE01]|nr:MAG: hypothetical protein CBR30_04410 [Dictyoglomus sp. NZ13-RE01]
MAKCAICNKRKGKRFCKSLGQWICAECCGEKRFKEIRCPSDCPYVLQAKEYSLEKIEELPPPWSEQKMWNLHLQMEYEVYAFLGENPDLTDADYLDALSVLDKEFEIRVKGLFSPPLMPKSPRALKLKNRLVEVFNKVLEINNEFGFPLYSYDDIRKVVSWEKDRILRYQENNKNVGQAFFLQILKRYVEYFISTEEKKASSLIYPKG